MVAAPNYREANECMACKFCKCTHSCGCCPSEYKCIRYDHEVYEYMVCDSFEEDK